MGRLLQLPGALKLDIDETLNVLAVRFHGAEQWRNPSTSVRPHVVLESLGGGAKTLLTLAKGSMDLGVSLGHARSPLKQRRPGEGLRRVRLHH